MHRYLRSIMVVPTGAGIVLAILTIPIQLSRQNGRVSNSSAIPTQSSTSKPENKTPPTDSYVPCVADAPNSASVKSSTTPGTVVKPHRVDLSWKASTSPGVAKYNVHRCSPGAPCTVSTSVITSVKGTSYTDTQVQPSHAYCYFVTAVADAGRPDSLPSNIIHVVIP
jgi:Na+-transporting methylmalonyl-CoA/oxaloacetate decarboxylase gamma subunit